MLIFCESKILVEDKKFYDFDYEYISSRKNIKIINTSENLPEIWQNLIPWADVEIEELNSNEELMSIREFLLLGDDIAKTNLSKAFQFRNWFKDIKFCSHCGGKLIPSSTDYGRSCENCGKTFYAPISPAVITAIEHEGKLLLAHNTAWPETRFSIIAGFVEPGERLEETVVREIREEVGIEVKNVKYFGSQTWPFPNSLMLGFTAEYLSGEIKPDGVEISKAGFYSPEEIRNMNIPDSASIARKLIENFLRMSDPSVSNTPSVRLRLTSPPFERGDFCPAVPFTGRWLT